MDVPIDRLHAVISRDQPLVLEVAGSDWLEQVVVEDRATSARTALPARALFVMVGAEPHTQRLSSSVRLDKDGYILTLPDLGHGIRRQLPWTALDRDPYLLETSVPGVLAAGDVRSASVKRAASAAGEGSIAIRFASEYLGRRASQLPTPGALPATSRPPSATRTARWRVR